MEDLLLLVHRIPYPPNKGDKIRSFNLLKYLAERYRVHLGAFIDDEQDWEWTEQLDQWCVDKLLLRLSRRQAKLRSVGGLLSGEALTLPFYRDARMQRWVDARCSDTGLRKAVVFSSAMAQYLRGNAYAGLTRIVDFVDVDSDKWRQYSRKSGLVGRIVYGRESKRLLAFERSVAAEFDASLFVSEAEAAMFRQLAPEVAERVDHYDNGVDFDYFAPGPHHANPYPQGTPAICFTGAMDYWANAEAVIWFVAEVLPAVVEAVPGLKFYIVGSNPLASVLELGRHPDVEVTGRVADVRPYLAHARLAVAPLRIARGIQNKVLEAMAMARPVVATPAAAEGLSPAPGPTLRIEEGAAEFAAAVVELVGGGAGEAIGRDARDYVVANYRWEACLDRLAAHLEPTAPTPVARRTHA